MGMSERRKLTVEHPGREGLAGDEDERRACAVVLVVDVCARRAAYHLESSAVPIRQPRSGPDPAFSALPNRL